MKNLSDNEIYDLMSSTNDEVSFENIVILFKAFSEMNRAGLEERRYSEEEPKQEETLEKVAEKESEVRYPVLTHSNPNDSPYVASKKTFKHGVRFGAKWQQERSYSEEEVKNIVNETIEKFYKHFYTLTKVEMKEKWFEQFKK